MLKLLARLLGRGGREQPRPNDEGSAAVAASPPNPPPADRAVASDPDVVRQSLYLDYFILRAVQDAAVRDDVSIHKVMVRAWDAAREVLLALRTAADLDAIIAREPRLGTVEHDGWTKTKQSVRMSRSMQAEMQQLATRLDCSLSQLMTAAWIVSPIGGDALSSGR